MAISVFWDDEAHNILRMHFDDVWTVEDFLNAVDDIRDTLQQSDKACDLIIDVTESGFPPSNFLTHFRKATEAGRVNYMILTGAGRMGDVMIQSVKRIYRSRGLEKLKTARSLNEARTLIHQLRAS